MPDCTTDKDPCDVMPLAGETWSICLPFGGRLWADGTGVHGQGGKAPADGVYGKIVIANGCIVGVEPEDVPLYTGSPCAPLPNPCGGTGDGGGSLGGDTGSSGVLGGSSCVIQGGPGVTVSGSGTESDPYVLSASGGSGGIYLRSANNAIKIIGDGSQKNPYVFEHKTGQGGTVGGMTFDEFGHMIGASSAGAGTSGGAGGSGTAGITPGYGIDVTPNNTTKTVEVAQQNVASDVPGSYQLGGYTVQVDKAGRITSVAQSINHSGAPVNIDCGGATLKINEFGSIVSYSLKASTGGSDNILVTWPAGAQNRFAQFTLKESAAVCGLCFSAVDSLADINFYIDDQLCTKVQNIFWTGGIFMAGTHQLGMLGGTGDTGIIIMPMRLADRTWS